mgnify:CR=1 FL=1
MKHLLILFALSIFNINEINAQENNLDNNQDFFITVSRSQNNTAISLQEWQDYMKMDTWAETFTAQEDILSLRRLEDVDGMPLIYTHIKTPFIVSNRCNFDCYYSVDEGDGSLI